MSEIPFDKIKDIINGLTENTVESSKKFAIMKRVDSGKFIFFSPYYEVVCLSKHQHVILFLAGADKKKQIIKDHTKTYTIEEYTALKLSSD